jgi:O-antigen/teichoic acid export membrane protein
MWLAGAQILTMPISVVINALLGRYLGPSEFGDLYLATTLCSFAFLVLEWGQTGTLPALVAANRERAAAFLGSALLWRALGVTLVAAFLLVLCRVLAYTPGFRISLALVALGAFIGTMLGVYLSVVRGFERSDVTAYAQVVQQVLAASLVVPVLLLGGHLRSVLLAQAAAAAVVFVVVMRAVRKMGVHTPRADMATARQLFGDGTSFLLLGLALALQPNIDAVFLSKLAPAEVVGWHAAARKLVGLLIFPVSALVQALYPTLSRLNQENPEEFARVTSDTLITSMFLVVPVATCCALYPEVGVRIYSEQSFGPVAQNLRLMAIFLVFLYLSMVLGSAIAATGKRRGWVIAQSLCLVVSAALDPILIPWFQARYANGGLGLCVSTIVSEMLMFAAGVWLSRPGILNRRVLGKALLTTLATGAMIGVALLLRRLSPFIGAPISVATYVAVQISTGALEKSQLLALRRMVTRRLSRA